MTVMEKPKETIDLDELWLFEPDDEIEEQALAEAEADVAAGRVIPWEKVRAWLLSWGKPDELPPPDCE
jgi:predicted transcriptional regulator